jgi:stress response protein YsnF
LSRRRWREDVTLHSERVSIDRRPASAGARVEDADFTDRTIEVTETDGAVVGKTTRVKEEVIVRKEATDRVDNARHGASSGCRNRA